MTSEVDTRSDLVWTYSGVRPLFDDGASAAREATRDYVLKVDGDRESGAVVNVFGGKLTTSRRLAESVLEKVEDILGVQGTPWTKGSKLPGGDFGPLDLATELGRLWKQYPGLENRMLRRMIRQYGTLSYKLLDNARTTSDLGVHFGADLYSREVDYLMDNEWARSGADVLWRRTKLGLRIKGPDVERLDEYMLRRSDSQIGSPNNNMVLRG